MKASVTFEYETRAPQTVSYTDIKGSPSASASKAIRRAKKDLAPRSWTSLVVLLDRHD